MSFGWNFLGSDFGNWKYRKIRERRISGILDSRLILTLKFDVKKLRVKFKNGSRTKNEIQKKILLILSYVEVKSFNWKPFLWTRSLIDFCFIVNVILRLQIQQSSITAKNSVKTIANAPCANKTYPIWLAREKGQIFSSMSTILEIWGHHICPDQTVLN